MRLPVVVLAGGLATRLYPVTKKIPKSLININDSPFVLHQLNLFHQKEIKHVHFCLGHLGDQVRDVIEKSIFKKQMTITFSFDGEKLLGTAGAIRKAIDFLPDSFFVTYGDSYLNIDYESIESKFLNQTGTHNGLMTIYRNAGKYDTSNVIYENDKIILYSKNQSLNNMNHIDFGLSILRKEHFIPYTDNEYADLSVILENLSRTGEMMGYELFERFYEIGSVQGIKDLSNYLNTNTI